MDRHWVCEQCRKHFPSLPIEMIEATDSLIEQCESNAGWDGICGSPEIRQRPGGLEFIHEDFGYPFCISEQWIDVQPNLSNDAEWIVLLRSGDVARLIPLEESGEVLFRAGELPFEIDDNTALLLSPNLDYVAIYQAFGEHACVLDVKTGAITARINRGQYFTHASHFSIVFFEADGKSLIAAATGWNRLDIIDSSTGVLLTDRGPTSRQAGEQFPPHYLDYFHGQLMVSPGGNWIVDNGWMWTPIGIVRSWDLRAWHERNPWESEDGPSVRELANWFYFMGGPLCWIDDATVAIWGWGSDEDWVIPAARLFDLSTGEEIRWFPGPETRFSWDEPRKNTAPSMFFDQYLFSVSDDHGTAVWDVQTGERLLQDTSLKPIHYHPGSREFLSMNSEGIRLSRLTRP